MSNIIYILSLIFIVFGHVPTYGEDLFGYMSYCSYNIGDDIQSIAAKQFLPKNAIPIDREFCGVFTSTKKVYTIMNGWYMHTKDVCWQRPDLLPPTKSWPPSNDIDPMLISIHFYKEFIPYAFSQEAVEYLRMHGPVGARDLNTLKELQKRNIPSYFSGCLTLTLQNNCNKRNDIIYVVDLDDECVNFIKSKTHFKVERLTHTITHEMAKNHSLRLEYANYLLEKYKKAKCVITGRLHASMPCLALETPVLLITGEKDPRFDGLRDLARRCTREELLRGQFDFDFNNPGENPKDYLIIRENLINIMKDWANRHGISPNL